MAITHHHEQFTTKWFVYPGVGRLVSGYTLWLTVLFTIIANISFESSSIFYPIKSIHMIFAVIIFMLHLVSVTIKKI